METAVATALHNWVPFKLTKTEPVLQVRWMYLGDTGFIHPFFEETVSACMHLPENSNKFRVFSDLSMLKEWAPQIHHQNPSAFIFHVSRCGSTLASQLLALDPANIVLSEVPLLDELLHLEDDEAAALFEAALSLYGNKRKENEERLFIKTDSWHVLSYKKLRALYPGVPFILLYRHPGEVIRSQQKRRGIQAVPGLLDPAIFGFNREEIVQMDFDHYMALVLETYYNAFLQIRATDELAVLVNYNEGPLNIVQHIAKATATVFPDEIKVKMEERAGFHAKYPDQVFSEPKNEMEIPAYQQKAFALYEELEKIRAGS